MYFDVAIIGDTQDAWAAADEAARRGCRTAVVRPDFDGLGITSGVAAVTATFNPSVRSSVPTQHAAPRDLWTAAVRCHERQTAELCQLRSIETWRGAVRFTDPTTIEVSSGDAIVAVAAHLLVIAAGSICRRPAGVDFDHHTIFVPEDVRQLSSAPEKLIILGGNPTARAFRRLFEYAGSAVTLVDGEPKNDAEDCQHGEVIAVFRESRKVTVRLSSDEEFSADALLFAADRMGATSSLGLASAGLETDEDGRLWCDSMGNTWLSSIAAAGEIVGFPKILRDQRSAARKLIRSHFADRSATGVSNQHHRQQRSRERRLSAASSAIPQSPKLRIFTEHK